ncbi:BT_3987 domain-containing protein [Mucilaginibacter phyllosphaerae]|uniref:DUF1735 domain-containing protein n=1 Tax=Mucilaginibacter phyllosphaerae TaxID=1812349 RepID=A0A4Y8ABT1_9SPHI|nr:DUF1735 domain-containing protein [Mucilaginibacter phyllosphaerae]MBB3969213.1 hypothetical protein [Mucilaginibacter phyllosphaerae]TEW65983.1 DUF1735 domain-containing protein [Mucilaginibacter phyllosphaerae]GGH07023.1 hypothetical protein GCM10007352_11540 [Mucilaginibacter phyllosphaerae]
MKKLNIKLKLSLAGICCMAAIIVTGCKKSLDFHDVILITGTESGKLLPFTVESAPATYAVTATSTGKVNGDVTVNFAVDTSLVASYNTEVSGKYFAAPAGSYELSGNTGVIKSGTNVSDAVNVKLLSVDKFVSGRTYIIPVTIKNVTGSNSVLEASRTVYLKISRVLDFNSIDISNPNYYATYKFAQPYTNISQFTYEIKCYVNQFQPRINRLCNWGPANEAYPNLLRFGEFGSDPNQLQWVAPGGSGFSSTRFATKTWYTVSCVFDGSKYMMYVNGKLDMSFDGSPRSFELGALELGMSYGGYQFSQSIDARISEIRLWNKALSRTEIANGLCGVDAKSDGLITYYKMNEGSGNVFYDRTGNGRDITWPNQTVWLMDDNNKCVQ